MKEKKLLLIAAAAAFLVSCGDKSAMSGDNSFPVQEVTTQSATLQSSYPAVLRGIQDVEIRPKVSGFITKICVKEGETVKAGQLLFVIDNVTYEATVREAEANVKTAKASLNTATLTYENSKKLFANKVIGTYEMQSAENSYLSAEAALAQAEAALSSAKENLSYCFVKSPADGVIGTLPYKVGALVSSSSTDALTTVSDMSSMDVYFSMNEKEVLEMLKAGGSLDSLVKNFPTVHLQLADGSIYDIDGKVTRMSGIIDQTTGALQMIAEFPNPNRILKSGGFGSVIIKHVNDDAIIIPKNSTMEVQNKVFIYVLGEENKVKYTEITVDPQDDGNNYIVTGGLKAGDKYVTNGITKLTDGATITPTTPEEYDKAIQAAASMSASLQ